MKKVVALVLLLFVSGCSSQFAYNNLDWLVHWYVDDYIDLDKPQKQAFNENFARWHAWHRQEELLKYETHLKELRELVDAGNFSAEDVKAQFDRGRGHWERLREQVTPTVVELAYMLTDEQIIELFDSLEEKNKEDEEERLEMTPEEIQKRFEEVFADQLKDYFGKLTKGQKAMVKQSVVDIIPNRLEWLKYRRSVQAAAQEVLMSRKDNPNFQQDFTEILRNPDAFKHEQYIVNNEHNRLIFAQMVVDAHATLTAKQKRRLYRKIDNFIEDFAQLRGDG